jgi:uncharacterized protein YegL
MENEMSQEHETEIVIIMDRSGSMESVRFDMEGGLNEFVEDQRNLNDGGCRLTLVQFDNQYELVYDAVPIADIPPIELDPRGITALLDAVGKTLTSLLERKPEGKVVILVVTDGHENASHEWTRRSVAALVRDCEAAEWEIVFLGANIDAFAEARSMGVNRTKAANYDANRKSVRSMFGTVSSKTSNFRTGRASSMDFSSRERDDIKAGEGITGMTHARPCSCHGRIRSASGADVYVHGAGEPEGDTTMPRPSTSGPGCHVHRQKS